MIYCLGHYITEHSTRRLNARKTLEQKFSRRCQPVPEVEHEARLNCLSYYLSALRFTISFVEAMPPITIYTSIAAVFEGYELSIKTNRIKIK